MTTINKANLRTVHAFVERRVPFDCNGTLTGKKTDAGTGQLPDGWRQTFRNAVNAADFFAVYSYATPIAWFANGEWTTPEVKYSPTTSRHMSALKMYKVR